MIQTEKIKLICPVCGKSLERNEKSCFCAKRHSFDIARQGYVNLLPVQNKHSLSPGDTRAMLLARRKFLDKGYYEPIVNDITYAIGQYCKIDAPVAADIGSGEGYYTAKISQKCQTCSVGIDIAKEAAKMACSRDKNILWAVATASHLPIADKSVDLLTAVFSLFVNDEYARVLKNGGVLIEVTAGSEHLIELKKIIYDQVFEQHKQPSPYGKQFKMLVQHNRKFTIHPVCEDLKVLLSMTPHIHRINREQSERIDHIDHMDLTVNYVIRVLQRI